MLDIHAQETMSFCDGITRRSALQIGTLGTLGLAMPNLLRQTAASETSGSGFGKAKRVILLFMWGGPAHQDTWDLKPHGPVETRGEFLPISTNVSGIHISEHFPLLARHADKLAILRSVGQEDNNHSTGAHAGLTGRKHEMQAENFAASSSDFPHFGSVLTKLQPNHSGLPTFVALPDIIATTNGTITPGQHAGILGRKYDPFTITDHPDALNFSIDSLSSPISQQRMQQRRGLLSQFDHLAGVVDRSAAVQSMDTFYQQALDMVLSPEARKAFDLSLVSNEERWRYGWHCFGQSVLMARRLVEAGVQLVTVYWHREKKTVDSSWDTHHLNFQELKMRLMPSVDRPIAALLQDLEERGLLEDTLVIWNSEFGRTPKINARGGRDHWGPCNSVVMAGGGVPGGQIFGASDANAAYPTANKVTQDDIAATIYHLLGLPPETHVQDRQGRPWPIALGEPIYDLLGGKCFPEPLSAPAPLPPRPSYGPFQQMLIERGGRFLCCEPGHPDGESEWKLSNFAPAANGKRLTFRTTPSEGECQLTYQGIFHGHFDYSHLVLHLASPQMLDELQIKINGHPLAVASQPGTETLWQIPLPPGTITSLGSFELTLSAPEWKVNAIALLGDPIETHHRDHLLGM